MLRRVVLVASWIWPLMAAASTLTMSFEDGLYPTTSYQGTRDTHLNDQSQPYWDPNANYSATVLRADGVPVHQAMLLRWDVSSIPKGTQLSKVSIRLNLLAQTVANFSIFECLRPWVASEATGTHYRNATSGDPGSWTVADADGVGTDRGSTVLGTMTGGPGALTFDLNASGIAVVQAWVNQSRPNNGFVVQNFVAGAALMASNFNDSNLQTRPLLIVTPLSGPTTLFQNGVSPTSGYQGGSGTLIADGLPPGYQSFNGNALYLSATEPALLSFDLTAIPKGSTVTSAALSLRVRQGSSSTFTMFEQLRPWAEARAAWLVSDGDGQGNWTYWETPGDLGTSDHATTALGTVWGTTAGVTEDYPFNTAGLSLVQRWIDAPSTNLGFVVHNDTATGTIVFAAREAPTGTRPELTVTFLPPATLALIPAQATVAPAGKVQFLATGGTPPYSFSLSQNLSGDSVDLTGAYVAGGVGGVTDIVQVNDAVGAQASAAVAVGDAMRLTPATADVLVNGVLQLVASGGRPPYEFTLVSPSGGSVDAQGLYQAGTTPNVTDTVQAVDAAGASASAEIHVHEVPSSGKLRLVSALNLADGARPGTRVTVSATVANASDGGTLAPLDVRFLPEGLTASAADGGAYDAACGCFKLAALEPGATQALSQSFTVAPGRRTVAVTTVVSAAEGEVARERVSADATPLRADFGCGCGAAGLPTGLGAVWLLLRRRRR